MYLRIGAMIKRDLTQPRMSQILNYARLNQFLEPSANHIDPSAFAVEITGPAWLTSWSLGHSTHMGFKITPSPLRIFDPFALFGIIVGVALIGLRIYRAAHPIPVLATATVYCITLLPASVTACIYSLFALRCRLRMSWFDQAIYFFIPLMFLIVCAVVLYAYTS